jgi:hypothetical protein
MPIKLTQEMHEAIQEAGESPVHIEDESTNEQFVLMPRSTYESLLYQRDVALSYLAPFREAFDDPAMDAYDDYDRHLAELNRQRAEEK